MADDVPAELELLLEPGEAVLWHGRPHYPHFRSEAWAAFVFGLIALTAASGAWLICSAVVRDIVANARYELVAALPIALIPAGGFSLVAVECLSAPWACRRRLARALYAVTDRRVIVRRAPGYARNGMVPEPERELYVFTPQQVRACEEKRRHGRRVDLVFASERARRAVVEIGILGAEDWAEAERALGTAFGWRGTHR
jgi:hypothetical protein